MADAFRSGQEWVAVKPFTPEEEWMTVEQFALLEAQAEVVQPTSLRITAIDWEGKTVTLESAPEASK